jgi:hypothetical protein
VVSSGILRCSILLEARFANLFTRKIPWRLSAPQKARQRKRLRAVDAVIATVDNALAKQGTSTKAVERWKEEMPSEGEMVPKDKYTMFDRKEKRYRKGIHSEFSLLGSNEGGRNVEGADLRGD